MTDKMYCAYDTLNPTLNPDGTEKHYGLSRRWYSCSHDGYPY